METEIVQNAGFWSGVLVTLVLEGFLYFLYTKITKKKMSFTGGSSGAGSGSAKTHVR